MTGHVHLVSAGPGAADLLTVRAARLLAQADVVIHDALVCEEVLALAPQAIRLNVGKRGGKVSTDQAFINKLIVSSAQKHACVVRLKGGDAMLFGRAQEEIEACRRAGVAITIVPGVSAAFGAAAQLQTSLTQRGIARSVTFVTPTIARGHQGDSGWAKAAASADTCVIYMGRAQSMQIRDALISEGLPASLPVVLAYNVERPEQGSVAGYLRDLPELSDILTDGPALLLLGEAFRHLVSRADDVREPKQQAI